MLWVFKAQGVHREALAALKVFCKAVEREDLTLEMVRILVSYLHRAQYDPGLRFEDDPFPKEERLLTQASRRKGKTERKG